MSVSTVGSGCAPVQAHFSLGLGHEQNDRVRGVSGWGSAREGDDTTENEEERDRGEAEN